jgi:hypothetical protein
VSSEVVQSLEGLAMRTFTTLNLTKKSFAIGVLRREMSCEVFLVREDEPTIWCSAWQVSTMGFAVVAQIVSFENPSTTDGPWTDT